MPTVKLVEAKSDQDREMLEEMVTASSVEGGVDPYFVGDPVYWLVSNESAQVVGYTGMHSFNPISRRCRGMLWIRPDFRRNGFGSAALDARNRMLFDQWNVNRIEWAIPTDNGPREAMSKLRSEHFEGTIRQAGYWNGKYHDFNLYGLTRDEFYQGADYEHQKEAAWQR